MDNGVEHRGGNGLTGLASSDVEIPDLYQTVVADAEKSDQKVLRDLSLNWVTDLKSGAETASGIGGFRYRIYTTEEFGTCCMYMWPGQSITTYYDSHEAGKMAMNDHYEALCLLKEEGSRELMRENELLKKRLQFLTLHPHG